MSIFRRDPPGPQQAASPVERRTVDRRPGGSPRERSTTLIAAGTRLTGEITGSAGLQVEGDFRGTIRLDSEVVIGPGGRGEGQISARVVRIGGRMQGDVEGIELVEITPSGALEGNISAARVVIAEGAFFKGQVEMPGKGDPSRGARRPASGEPSAPAAGPAPERPVRPARPPEPQDR